MADYPECAAVFAAVLLLVAVLLIIRCHRSNERYINSNSSFGIDPRALAAVTGVEYMKNDRKVKPGAYVDQIAMAKTIAMGRYGRVNTEGNPKLLSMAMDPRYKQYGAGRGGVYQY